MVKKRSIEIVSEIVVFVDVFLAAVDRVSTQLMLQPIPGVSYSRPGAVQRIYLTHVSDENANEIRQVVRSPLAVHVRFGRADCPAQQSTWVHRGVGNRQSNLRSEI